MPLLTTNHCYISKYIFYASSSSLLLSCGIQGYPEDMNTERQVGWVVSAWGQPAPELPHIPPPQDSVSAPGAVSLYLARPQQGWDSASTALPATAPLTGPCPRPTQPCLANPGSPWQLLSPSSWLADHALPCCWCWRRDSLRLRGHQGMSPSSVGVAASGHQLRSPGEPELGAYRAGGGPNSFMPS